MITRIKREIKRDGLTADTRDAIRTSIAYYSERRLDFNDEDTSTSVDSSVSTLVYPANFLEIDRLELSSTGTDRFELDEISFDEVRERTLNNTGKGVPSGYAVFDNVIYFDLTTDRPFAVRTWGLKQLPEISASSTTTDTNAWMTTGEELIRSHAKMILFRDVLRNQPASNEMAAAATIAIRPLEHRAVSKQSTGRVEKTVF